MKTIFFFSTLLFSALTYAMDPIDLNAQTDRGETAIFRSAAYGHLHMVEFLHDKGAEIELANCSGLTPLATAVAHGHVRIVHFLLSVGANVNAKTAYEATVQDLANSLEEGETKKQILELIQNALDGNDIIYP